MNQQNLESMLTLFRKLVSGFQLTELSNVFGKDIFPFLLGRTFSVMAGDSLKQDEEITACLNNIHTETTISERKFLYNFFKYIWDGNGDVLEIGPFLGGTTRAIAKGMLDNIDRKEGRKIFTYDKFKGYYQPEQLINSLKPAFQSGLFSESVKEGIRNSGNFLEVFELFHKNQNYFGLIDFSEGVLPFSRNSIAETENIFKIEEEKKFSAVFIDGAKSWYGLKYFMQETVPHTEEGSYYIFQDFGARTCFWIPVFIERFKDIFEFTAFVDDTYTFKLLRKITLEEIDKRFPDNVEDFSASDYEMIFRNLMANAINIKDMHSYLILQLQYAAALSYIGEHEKGRNLIIDLLKTPFGRKYKNIILLTLDIPTYNDNGNIFIQ